MHSFRPQINPSQKNINLKKETHVLTAALLLTVKHQPSPNTGKRRKLSTSGPLHRLDHSSTDPKLLRSVPFLEIPPHHSWGETGLIVPLHGFLLAYGRMGLEIVHWLKAPLKSTSLPLQKAKVQLPAPTQGLTTVCNSSPVGSNALFCPPGIPGL